VDRAALAAGYGPAPFWDDQGRRLALGQLRMLIGYTAHDLRAGKRAHDVPRHGTLSRIRQQIPAERRAGNAPPDVNLEPAWLARNEQATEASS